LALSAGELGRPAALERLQAKEAHDLGEPACAFSRSDSAHAHPERQILCNRHRRVERVGLEHERDVPLRRL
jgi:hypothetical protein